MAEIELSLANASIGIITALPEEFTAACEVLGCAQLVSKEGRIYKLGTVRCRDLQGAHVVVVCRLVDMGNNAAAATTARLPSDCPNVTEVIMCGIAGAVPNPGKPSDDVRLGDIVVSTEAVQYDFERVSERGPEMRPIHRQPSRRLLEVARLLQSEEERSVRPWERYIAQATAELGTSAEGGRWKRPLTDTDTLRLPRTLSTPR